MTPEVCSVVNYFGHLLERNNARQNLQLTVGDIEKFKKCLLGVLESRLKQHWYPEKPLRWSIWRRICIAEHRFDPVLLAACVQSQISIRLVKKCLPSNLVVWIDPGEVNCRIGDDGPLCIIYHAKADGGVAWESKPHLLASYAVPCKPATFKFSLCCCFK